MQVGLAILKKVGSGGPYESNFDGLFETDIVFIVSKILEASGYLCYHEDPYPAKGRERNKVDIYGIDWKGNKLYCEAKVLYIGRDNRLNRNRFETGSEVIKDAEHLLDDTGGCEGLQIIVAFSPEESMSSGSSQSRMSLDETIDSVRERCNQAGKGSCIKLMHASFEVDDVTLTLKGDKCCKDSCRYLHVAVIHYCPSSREIE